MFQEPDYRENLSLMLSEVLHDIGVNERMVMRRRRNYMLKETMNNIIDRVIDLNVTEYFLGSQSEGTTTIGLGSDLDVLVCDNNYNIIQDLSEWEQDKVNYLMIQNENTTPGYCLLQMLRHDAPLPVTVVPNEHHMNDRSGKVLYKNTVINGVIQGAVGHGPSLAEQGQPGFSDKDVVLAYSCKSWPQSASGWLDRQGIGRWPTQDMRRYAARTGCFVVPTGCKVSEYPELEWRISTSLAERCLMLHLNITQIRCYVLLKIILKSFLNPRDEINISSFMCKTVLLHCIENTEPSVWKDNNLFICLTYCLLKLHSCVQNDCCSHSTILENNLMAGQFTAETKHELSKNICKLIQNDTQWLLRINIDNLGCRLQVKLNRVPHGVYYFLSSLEIYEQVLTLGYIGIATNICAQFNTVLKHFQNEYIRTIKPAVVKLMNFSNNGNRLEHAAFKLLAPFLYTTYGSFLALSGTGENNQVSPEALVWLSAGLNSDISSSRLKLVSEFYSTDDMEKAELILRHTEEQYYSNPVVPICGCWTKPIHTLTAEIKRICSEESESYIKHITAFCVRFIRKEINCIPHELQYEMFRSTQDDMINRDEYRDYWMNWAVVDSLPFLYFLQYKIYRHLQRHQDQRQALSKLIRTIETDENLGHRETALNILGQCLEQENRPQQALKCYLLSLQQRARNNAANFHICKLLSGLLLSQ
jgi:tetratricopeptide (TPR) repeat protein